MSHKPKKAKASKATIAQRVHEVLSIRLEGAAFWDVLQYVAEKQAAGEEPWKLPDGEKPFAERTIWWYIQRADQLLKEAFRKEAGRKRLLRRHLAQRRRLYAGAFQQGDYRCALAVLDSEAKLTGLFEDEVTRQIEQLQKQVAEIKANANGNGQKATGGTEKRSGEAANQRAADLIPAPKQPGPLHGDGRAGAGPVAVGTVDDLLTDDQPPLFG